MINSDFSIARLVGCQMGTIMSFVARHYYKTKIYEMMGYSIIGFYNGVQMFYVKLSYHGYDLIAEKHGIVLEALDEKEVFDTNTFKGLLLDIPSVIGSSNHLIKVECWNTHHKDLEFPKIVTVLVFYFASYHKAYFVLSDRNEANFSISKKEPIDFFKMTYSIDFEERNMILLGKF